MYCPECKEEFPGKFCPECGSKLIEKPRQEAVSNEMSVNLGDANAIAGDVNISHNVTHIERNKSDKELNNEAEAEYRELCKEVLADGIITREENNQLRDAQTRLGLSDEQAEKILAITKAGMQRSSKSELGKIQKVTLNQILKLRDSAKMENLAGSLGRLEAMANKFDADEVQCNYWMIQSGLDPKATIEKYEGREEDNYWQTFWTAMAYINTGNSGEAEGLISDLESWGDMPFGNIALLAAANALNEYWNDTEMVDFKDQAQAFVEEGGGESTDLIDNFTRTLMLLMVTEDYSQISEPEDDLVFQLDYLLKGITSKIKKAQIKDQIPEIPKTDLLPE